MTKIKRCSCKHTYQDERYGKGKRVHNSMSALNSSGSWRCTVCGTAKK